ncbi:hypothetical protein Tco_0879520 [Tanacetum coccineum]
MINLNKKLQALKIVIKQWTTNAKKNSYKAKISIQSKLSNIDKIIDQGHSNEEILSDRTLLLKELNDINSIDSLEATQKSKPVSPRICFIDQFTNRLSLEQQADLERNVSNEEIKSAVWDCGTNKFPGPDGITFEFFRLFSDIPIDSSLTLSNLFFVDGVIFVGKWGSLNMLEVWPFFSHGSCLWTKFIKAIYGEYGALNSLSSLSKHSPWLDIIREVIVLRTKGINLLDSIRKKVCNGLTTLFWEDPWLDDLALKHKFSRLYALDNYKQITVVEKINHASMVDTFRRPPRGGVEEVQLRFLLSRMDGLILTNIPDRWVWSLEATCEFLVKFVRQLIDDSILLKEEVTTR